MRCATFASCPEVFTTADLSEICRRTRKKAKQCSDLKQKKFKKREVKAGSPAADKQNAAHSRVATYGNSAVITGY